jgi:Na+-transporting NADH:ubiquinone oxidoreductase subunit NqrA
MKLVKCCIWSIAVYGGKTWTLQKVDQKYLERSEMWRWRKMEISWTDHVRNAEVLHRVKKGRSIIYTIKRGKVNWIGHILGRNCLLKHVIEGKTERRGRRYKQLLDDLQETRQYGKLKEDATDCTLWTACFERAYRPIIRVHDHDDSSGSGGGGGWPQFILHHVNMW